MNKTQIEEAVQKVGGRFKFVVLLQRRIRELYKKGLKPNNITEMEELLMDEILQGKVQFDLPEEKKK